MQKMIGSSLEKCDYNYHIIEFAHYQIKLLAYDIFGRYHRTCIGF